MKTVAIICEYNPFHTGHKYQIDSIRQQFGPDCAIIAIMSGNYTQRGEIAIADKLLRAKCAVECGVNLVLELPFPYSASSAEFFAKAGVSIANSLQIVDYLSFGSECGDLSLLSSIADAMLSKDYTNAFHELQSNSEYANMGYAKLCTLALKKLGLKNAEDVISSPNNILAIEYIKALRRSDSKIAPHTHKRMGAGYNDCHIENALYQSASSIRQEIICNNPNAFDYIPSPAKEEIALATEACALPCDAEKLSSFVISYFRLASRSDGEKIHDAKGGLYNRLIEKSFESDSINKLVENTATKKFTDARIRRAIWYSLFGVTSSDIRENPMYTQLLAMDDLGRMLLCRIKKESDIAVITKPSNTSMLSDTAARQKQISDKADSLFQLTKPCFTDGNYSIKLTPYVKK